MQGLQTREGGYKHYSGKRSLHQEVCNSDVYREQVLAAVFYVCRGFPPALVNLKQQLSEHHPTLPKENPGSRWPKTSLGALKDGTRLTPDQLNTLLAICR